MRILITGGAGFIGSAVVRHFLENTQHQIVNVDKLTYAADPASALISDPRYRFERHDICDRAAMDALFQESQPDAVMHLAAESHVDRSIEDPGQFLQTNVMGTYTLMASALTYWYKLPGPKQRAFRFHHVSTDEVYGDLEAEAAPFSETTRYAPSSPYAASKAASDHLVRAWGRTYGFPILISNCSNNYGPGQFPEKLIPLMIMNAIDGQPLPVYGDGRQIRDWLYVADHAAALHAVLDRGEIGETYNIGGSNERTNLDVVTSICRILDRLFPDKPNGLASFSDLIVSVPDRPGHDRRYAIDSDKISKELGWTPNETFLSGLEKTIEWYLANRDWCDSIGDKCNARSRRGLELVSQRAAG